MRIISGTAGGRRLDTLSGTHTRPTADRVKEALFSALEPRLYGARVLDAFAGSGALGLEALSRGAAEAILIEQDARAAAVAAKNIATLGFSNARLQRGDCMKWLRARRGQEPPFDIIFADPPYNRGLLPALLREVADNGWLSETGLLVAETTTKDSELAICTPWEAIKQGRYGDTSLYYCRLGK